MTTALKLSGVTLPGAGYPNRKNFVVPQFPVSTGLVGLYTIGGTQALSLLNHANSALPLTLVGSPTIAALGATCNLSNCFDTGIQSPAALTMIAVAQLKVAATGDEGMMCSNYLSATGDSLIFRVNGTAKASALWAQGGTTGASEIDVSAGTAGQWNSFAGRIKSTGEAKSWRSVSGSLTVGAESAANAARVPQARNLRVGGHYNTGAFTGNVTVQMVAIFNTALADADIASNLAYLTSTYGPAIGLTTL